MLIDFMAGMTVVFRLLSYFWHRFFLNRINGASELIIQINKGMNNTRFIKPPVLQRMRMLEEFPLWR